MEIQEQTVREMLEGLKQQHERLQRELWATEGAIAACMRLLEPSPIDPPLRAPEAGAGKEGKHE